MRIAASLASALEGAQIVVLVTRWQEFAQLASLARRMQPEPLVIDGRRMLDPAAFKSYEGIGRGA